MNCSVGKIRKILNHQNSLDFRDIAIGLRASRCPNETLIPWWFSLDSTTRWCRLPASCGQTGLGLWGAGCQALRLPCFPAAWGQPGTSWSLPCQADLCPLPPAVSPREAQHLCVARVCSSSKGWLRKHLGCLEDLFLAEITWDLGRSMQDPRRPCLMTAR